ncbi:hypothetical protein ACOBV9_19035 (plasmid) [Pseudoalteromonas espejiana]
MDKYPQTDIQLDLNNKVLNVIEEQYDIAFRIGSTKFKPSSP